MGENSRIQSLPRKRLWLFPILWPHIDKLSNIILIYFFVPQFHPTLDCAYRSFIRFSFFIIETFYRFDSDNLHPLFLIATVLNISDPIILIRIIYSSNTLLKSRSRDWETELENDLYDDAVYIKCLLVPYVSGSGSFGDWNNENERMDTHHEKNSIYYWICRLHELFELHQNLRLASGSYYYFAVACYFV